MGPRAIAGLGVALVLLWLGGEARAQPQPGPRGGTTSRPTVSSPVAVPPEVRAAFESGIAGRSALLGELTPEERQLVRHTTRLLGQGDTEAGLAEWERLVGRYLASSPHGDIMAVLYGVFREAIEEANEDKRYWLDKLGMLNSVTEALSDYHIALDEVTGQLGAGAGESGTPQTGRGLPPARVLVQEKEDIQAQLGALEAQRRRTCEGLYRSLRQDPAALQHAIDLERLLRERAETALRAQADKNPVRAVPPE